MKRKYTVTADDSDTQLERNFEFHSLQNVQIISKGNIYTNDISKLIIYASSPNFSSLGELNVTFSLDEEDGNATETYRIGNLYDCISELMGDFNKLEAGIIGHFVENKNFTFRGNKEDLYVLEFEDIRGEREDK